MVMKMSHNEFGYLFILTGILLFGILLMYGCTPDPGSVITSEKTLPPVINAFLNTAADSQYVVLSALTGNSPEDYQKILDIEVPLVRNAKVFFIGENKSFIFKPVYMKEIIYPDDLLKGFMRYWASTEPIHPGESYWLKVSIPGKGEYSAW